ncbi:8-oxoguanine DNA glycosylase [Tirmania nivea]|nr:8-oxoguanine DNA glycosylase [Tirmania nivea]
MAARCIKWCKMSVTSGELCISTVLRCGQSFRWKNSGDEWSCALYGRIISLKQDPTHLHYRVIYPAVSVKPITEPGTEIGKENDDTESVLRDYFNLSVDLTKLYKTWSEQDPVFMKKAPKFMGVRMLRQDPWENLISFICSTNNNISRIGQMVEKLCVNYGPKLGELNGIEYYDFPPPEKLAAAGVEQKLRDLGFGYRAKYIATTAQVIAHEKSLEWLHGLRKEPYKVAHEALLELSGVGPKVADCVCLMSMDKAEAVPVDTHVWQIAIRDYKFGKGKLKSLTPATYWAIGDHFRELWGKEAGWAHSVLFTADLRAFSERSEAPPKVKVKVKFAESSMDEETGGVIGKRRLVGDLKVTVKVKEESATTNTMTTTVLRRSKRVKQ